MFAATTEEAVANRIVELPWPALVALAALFILVKWGPPGLALLRGSKTLTPSTDIEMQLAEIKEGVEAIRVDVEWLRRDFGREGTMYKKTHATARAAELIAPLHRKFEDMEKVLIDLNARIPRP